MESSFFSLCVLLFIIVDPIGSVPAILALIKGFKPRRQGLILARESLIALTIALFFQYFGEWFLSVLHIEDYVLRLASGILILIVALEMLFGSEAMAQEAQQDHQEPFLFPIATPLLSGPGLLAVLMIQTRSIEPWLVSLALIVVWIGVFAVLLLAPLLQRLLGNRGLKVFEQLMAIVIAMIAMEMLVQGSGTLLKKL